MSLVADLREANTFDHSDDRTRRRAVMERLRGVLARVHARSELYRRDRAVIEALLVEHDVDRFFLLYRDVTPLTKHDLANSFDKLVTDPGLTLEKCAAFDAAHTAGDGLLTTTEGGAHQVLKTSGTSGSVVYIVDRVANIKRVMANVLFRALFRYAYRTGLFAYFLPLFRPLLRTFRGRPLPKKRARATLSAGQRLLRALRPAVMVFVHRGNRSVYRGTTSHSQPWWVRALVHVELVSHESSLEAILDRAEDIDAEFIFGLPSRLEWLARAQQKGEIALDPLAVYVGGETLKPELVALFAEAWPRAHVVNTYGATETKATAIACPECREMHLLEDIVYLELYDDQGKQAAEGTAAEHVYATSLRNEVLPVLRYAMTDRIVRLPDAGCRLRTTRIRVEGREPAFVWAQRTDTGAFTPLNGRMLKERLVGMKGSSGFLLTYREVGALDLRVVAAGAPDDALRDRARNALDSWAREQGAPLDTFFANVRIELVDQETWNREGGKLDAIVATVVPPTLTTETSEGALP
jgi:phenylacetate-coenzyme A ligase PaaK-like adenylate-forming protein